MRKRSPNPSRFQFEIDLSPSGTRVDFEFRLDLLGEVGKQHDPTSLLESSDVVILGVGELVRWLSKPPEPLATQTHELKMKVAPLGGVMVLKTKVAIELADELAEPPTWRASYQCLPPSLLKDTLSSKVCR